MNTVLAIVLLGAAYASAEAGYLSRGYGGYGGYGRGYYGKREADAVAEADAEPGYLSRGYGYGGYGYGGGYYGKREAEAEPGYLRGYGGYGYGRGYGGYGYGGFGYYGDMLWGNQDILEDMVVMVMDVDMVVMDM